MISSQIFSSIFIIISIIIIIVAIVTIKWQNVYIIGKSKKNNSKIQINNYTGLWKVCQNKKCLEKPCSRDFEQLENKCGNLTTLQALKNKYYLCQFFSILSIIFLFFSFLFIIFFHSKFQKTITILILVAFISIFVGIIIFITQINKKYTLEIADFFKNKSIENEYNIQYNIKYGKSFYLQILALVLIGIAACITSVYTYTGNNL